MIPLSSRAHGDSVSSACFIQPWTLSWIKLHFVEVVFKSLRLHPFLKLPLRGLPCSVFHSLLEQHWLVPHALFHGIQLLKCAPAHEDSVPCTHGTALLAPSVATAHTVEGNAVTVVCAHAQS